MLSLLSLHTNLPALSADCVTSRRSDLRSSPRANDRVRRQRRRQQNISSSAHACRRPAPAREQQVPPDMLRVTSYDVKGSPRRFGEGRGTSQCDTTLVQFKTAAVTVGRRLRLISGQDRPYWRACRALIAGQVG